MKLLLIVCAIIGATELTLTQPAYTGLSRSQNRAYNSYLLRTVHTKYKDRSLHLHKAMLYKSSMITYRDALHKYYQAILGPMLERSVVHTQTLHSSQYEGFKLETLVFQSLPGRCVTANLYLPPGPGPHPAILELYGHGINGNGHCCRCSNTWSS